MLTIVSGCKALPDTPLHDQLANEYDKNYPSLGYQPWAYLERHMSITSNRNSEFGSCSFSVPYGSRGAEHEILIARYNDCVAKKKVEIAVRKEAEREEKNRQDAYRQTDEYKQKIKLDFEVKKAMDAANKALNSKCIRKANNSDVVFLYTQYIPQIGSCLGVTANGEEVFFKL